MRSATSTERPATRCCSSVQMATSPRAQLENSTASWTGRVFRSSRRLFDHSRTPTTKVCAHMIDPRPPRAPMPRVIDYEQRQVMSDPRVEQLSSESQAALRQFSEDRLIGYGVERADAGELRERVLRGVPWKEAATMIA